MKKIILLIVLALAGGYWLLLSKPGLYFDKTREYRIFTLHARGALPENMDVVLDKAYDKISAAELFTQDKKFDTYLASGRKEFVFFTPFQNGDYYRVNPRHGFIYMAPSDFASDQVRTAPEAKEYKALSLELAGAAAREMARRIVEPLKYMFMSEWKLRGYSERVNGGTGTYMPADICKGDDPARLDFEYAQAVDFALRVDGLSLVELFGKDYSYETVQKALKKMNCGG